MKLVSDEQADKVADLYAASLRLVKMSRFLIDLESISLLGNMVAGFSEPSFKFPVYTANTKDLATDKDVKKQYDDFEDSLHESFKNTDFVLGLFTTPDADEAYRYILTLFLENSAGQILNPFRISWTEAGMDETTPELKSDEWDDTIYTNYSEVRESWGFTTTELESQDEIGYEIIIYALEPAKFSFKKTLNWRQFPESLM